MLMAVTVSTSTIILHMYLASNSISMVKPILGNGTSVFCFFAGLHASSIASCLMPDSDSVYAVQVTSAEVP